MSERITRKLLQVRVNYIAKRLNRPATMSTVDESGQRTANIGYLFIDHYNPGDNPYQYKLAEICNDGYAEHDWTNYRMTGKEFYAYLNGIIDGLEHSRK